DRSADEQSRGHPGQRRATLAPVLRECVLWRRLHARRRLRASREPVQPARCARQLYHPGLQTNRGGAHRASSVPSPWRLVARRRLARGDTSGFLWPWDGYVERRSHRLRLSTAVRVGHPYALADTAAVDAAGRSGTVPVVT